jgi:hypothetical protein
VDGAKPDIVKDLALAAIAVAVVFGGYFVATKLVRSRHEGQARSMVRTSLAVRDGLYFGRFVDVGEGGQCLEFTLLNRAGQTMRHGTARIIDGALRVTYPSFEECRIRAAG